MQHLLVPLTALLITASAAPAASQATPTPPRSLEEYSIPSRTAPRWNVGQPLMQGFFGASEFERVEVDTDGPGEVDGDRGELDTLPVIGGGAQWKLGGERLDYGLEGLMSFSWRGDAEAFVVGGGGAAVAVDVDVLLFELFGGPFASVFLGEKARLYGAAGPVMQWADYSQSGNGLGDDGSGFGVGWYARTGVELALPSRTWLGFGVRWSDSTIDLGGNLGDLDIEGLQAVLTVSRGI
ncbi:MAG TPA: hypothetical protein VF530_17675 [Planctomycetota bacterium]